MVVRRCVPYVGVVGWRLKCFHIFFKNVTIFDIQCARFVSRFGGRAVNQNKQPPHQQQQQQPFLVRSVNGWSFGRSVIRSVQVPQFRRRLWLHPGGGIARGADLHVRGGAVDRTVASSRGRRRGVFGSCFFSASLFPKSREEGAERSEEFDAT